MMEGVVALIILISIILVVLGIIILLLALLLEMLLSVFLIMNERSSSNKDNVRVLTVNHTSASINVNNSIENNDLSILTAC